MMQLQLVFNELEGKKQELRVLKMDLKTILEDNPEYTTAAEQIKSFRNRQKIIKLQTEEANSKLMDKIDKIKIDLQLQKELVTDTAINQLMAGETVEVEDMDGKKRIPVWKVTFKKTDE